MTLRKNKFNYINQIYNNPDQALVVIGPSYDGPTDIPFTLSLDVDPYEVLGESPLADALQIARDSSLSQIVLYRVNGNQAEAVIPKKTDIGLEDTIELVSFNSGSIYNHIQAKVFPDHLFVIDTDGNTHTYSFDLFPKCSDLCYRLNQDAEFGLIEFNAYLVGQDSLTKELTDVEIDLNFKNGDDELNLMPDRENTNDISQSVTDFKNKLASILFGDDIDDQTNREANGLIAEMNFGVITLAGFYFDDDPELGEMIGSFCLNKIGTDRIGTIGVIGTKPIYPDINGDILDDVIEDKANELLALAGVDNASTISIKDGDVVPTITLTYVKQDADSSSASSGYNFSFTLTDFSMSDVDLNTEAVSVNTGYIQLYIDSKGINTKIVDPTYLYGALSPGTHIIAAELRANDGSYILLNGNKIQSSVVITVPGEVVENINPIVNIQAYNYIQVIVGDALNDTITGLTPLSLYYAAEQASRPYQLSMTNKSLAAVSQISYQFDKANIDLLSRNGYILTVASIRKGFVPYQSHGFTKNLSVISSHPECLRVAQMVTYEINEAIHEYIGNAFSTQVETNMRSDVQNILDTMVANEVLQSYSVSYSKTSETSAIFNIKLIPYSTIQNVSTISTISFNEEAIDIDTSSTI